MLLTFLAQPEKSARKAQETRDQQNVAHARNKSREEGAQRSKVGDESKAQGHRPKQQPPPLIADEPAPQPRVEHNRQGHDSRRQMDRRFSGGGGYPRQDGQGYRHDGQGYRNDGQGYRQHDGQGYRQDGQGYPRLVPNTSKAYKKIILSVIMCKIREFSSLVSWILDGNVLARKRFPLLW